MSFAQRNISAEGESWRFYVRSARRYPLLDREEEQALIRAWQDHEDQGALNRLVGSHMRMAVRLALQYRGYHLPVEDLIAQSNMGLVQAIQHYDARFGCRLSTYAVWWMKAAIQDYVLKSWSMVRIGTTSKQKRLFFNLRGEKAMRSMGLHGESMTPQDAQTIADHFCVSSDDIMMMDERLHARDMSLNAPRHEQNDEEWIDSLFDGDEGYEGAPERDYQEKEEKQYRLHLLQRAMGCLSHREKHIVRARLLSSQHVTLETLGADLGLSRERVRQIESHAIRKLRRFVLQRHREHVYS
ncbi:MAG: RNA polymerase factor sigma-32 [Alphaproteobacteria bacterium GM7ARS4]|nr:RNA polymerase factor sigma-32 [Alphaproteobacteria bacterium GM7ARS4]